MGPEALDVFPRLGWVPEPTPLTPLPSVAARLGARSVTAKRDDACAPLFGGSKTRKLDFLLPGYRDAPLWAGVGATGSGHLVALVEAGRQLGHRVEAHVFPEPESAGVRENLAFVASYAERVVFHPDRLSLAIRRPSLLVGDRVGEARVVPPGGTNADGMLGMVRAGLELAAQVSAGLLPAPDVVYVPWGSGGAATGLAQGLALGGLRPEVRGVAAVERAFSRGGRARRLARLLRDRLATAGLAAEPAPLALVRGHLGAGYGAPTDEGLAAIAEAGALGVPLEAVYSGKAWAAMCAAPDLAGKNVLFWVTDHRPGLPSEPGWEARVPAASGPSRRAVLGGLGAVAAAGCMGLRVTGYRGLPGGVVLSGWEAEVVAAAAEAILADTPGAPLRGPSPAEVAANVDRYLVGMPREALREVHAMFAAIEHGTLLGGKLPRFTRLPPEARLDFLRALGGPLAPIWRGIRDLCLLGYWQDPRTWPETGYGGPWGGGVGDRYADLAAPPGALPKGAR